MVNRRRFDLMFHRDGCRCVACAGPRTVTVEPMVYLMGRALVSSLRPGHTFLVPRDNRGSFVIHSLAGIMVFAGGNRWFSLIDDAYGETIPCHQFGPKTSINVDGWVLLDDLGSPPEFRWVCKTCELPCTTTTPPRDGNWRTVCPAEPSVRRKSDWRIVPNTERYCLGHFLDIERHRRRMRELRARKHPS